MLFAIVNCNNLVNTTLYFWCLFANQFDQWHANMYMYFVARHISWSSCAHNLVRIVLIVLVIINIIPFPFDVMDQFIFVVESAYDYNHHIINLIVQSTINGDHNTGYLHRIPIDNSFRNTFTTLIVSTLNSIAIKPHHNIAIAAEHAHYHKCIVSLETKICTVFHLTRSWQKMQLDLFWAYEMRYD